MQKKTGLVGSDYWRDGEKLKPPTEEEAELFRRWKRGTVFDPTVHQHWWSLSTQRAMVRREDRLSAGRKGAITKAKNKAMGIPDEDHEQRELAKWLDANLPPHSWCHVPNEGKRTKWGGQGLKAKGLKPGVPDVLIFTRPAHWLDVSGVAIELKRADGGRVSGDQRDWIESLENNGWIVSTQNGHVNAIRWLKKLGYGSTHTRTQDDLGLDSTPYLPPPLKTA